MPQKKEPPRVEFTPYTVKRCRFERPRSPPKREWIKQIKKKEVDFSYHSTEDVDRLRGALDPKRFFQVCKALGIEPSQGRTSVKRESQRVVEKLSTPVEEVAIELEVEEEQGDSLKSLTSAKEEEYRQSMRESLRRMQEARPEETVPRPYHVELTSESSCPKLPFGDDVSDESTLSLGQGSMTVSDDLLVNSATTRSGSPEDILDDLRSPYQKFFCRGKKEIENHLNKDSHKQAHTEADKIYLDLIKFLNLPEIELKCPNISLDSLRNLFDIRPENPAAHAFSLDMKELPYVPKEVADFYDDIQASSRASLHRQITWDMLYEKGKERLLAFGSRVSNPRRRWNRSTKKDWLLSDEMPWDLVSGKDLWKDLMKTEILEGFAKWLLANPQYDRPKYLEKVKYFENIPKDFKITEDPVKASLKKKRYGEAFYALANNMKYFIGDNELSYLPRLEELNHVMQLGHQVPGEEYNIL